RGLKCLKYNSNPDRATTIMSILMEIVLSNPFNRDVCCSRILPHHTRREFANISLCPFCVHLWGKVVLLGLTAATAHDSMMQANTRTECITIYKSIPGVSGS